MVRSDLRDKDKNLPQVQPGVELPQQINLAFFFSSLSFVLFCFLCKIMFFKGFRLSKMPSMTFQKSAKKYFGQSDKKLVL